MNEYKKKHPWNDYHLILHKTGKIKYQKIQKGKELPEESTTTWEDWLATHVDVAFTSSMTPLTTTFLPKLLVQWYFFLPLLLRWDTATMVQPGLPMFFFKKNKSNWSSLKSGWLVGPVWLSMAAFSVDFMNN